MNIFLAFFNLKIRKKSSLFNLRTALLLVLIIILSCATDKTEDQKNSDPLLGIGYGIGSSSFFVNNLKSTRDYYVETLGFDMPNTDKFKKSHLDGAVTARINFPGMTSIEFLSIEDSLVTNNAPSYITDFLAKHEGVEKYSLSSSSVDTTYS